MKKDFKQRKRRLVSISAILLLTLVFFSSNIVAQDDASSENEEALSEEEGVFELEEIVVSGIRGSLQLSAQEKRDADIILEAITPEDLGKFPDNNVVESLQRLTGVTISRNDRGEGQDVTIRGFGPGFVKTTANGRTLAGLSISDMPAELIAGAEVYKSSSADTKSGAIGGVINLETARPFDFEGRQMVATAKGTYESLSGDYAPSLFGMYSDTFADNKWGVLLSVSQQNRNSRTDKASASSYIPHSTLSSDGVVVEGAEDVFYPKQQIYNVTTSKIERTGASGAVQFAPTPQLVLTLDGLYNKSKPDDETFELSHYFTNDNITAATIGANDTVISMTTNEWGHTDFCRSMQHTVNEMFAAGLNMDWKSENEMLKLNLDLSTSTNKRKSDPGAGGYLVAGYRNVINWEYTGSGVPSITAIGIPEIGVLGGTFTDPTFTNAHFMMYETGGESKDTINEAMLDGQINFGDRLLSRMNFGVLMSKKENESSSNGMIDLFGYQGYWQPLDPSVLKVFNAGSDFLGGDSNAPTAWLTFEPLDLLYYLRDVSGNPDLLTPQEGGPGGPPGPGGGSGGAWEKGAAVYLQADLEGEIASKPWKVNLGVRYNRTEVGQPGFSSSTLIDLLPVPGDPTMYQTVYDDSETVEITEGGTFTNWLPTLNARLNWTDELVLRFSASQSLTDPNLGDMSPGLRWGMPRPNNLTASAGNPDLEPYLSTNLDVSGEWYYNRGGYVSATLFSKQVDNYIVSGYATEYLPMGNSSGDFPDGLAEVRVNRPRNVEVAKVKGIELSFSHNFFYLSAPWDGFGFAVNATFVDCPDTMAPGEIDTERAFALEGVGDSQNLMVYYERGPIGIRASYNHRDDYLQRTFNGEGNEPLFAKGSGQLDIRASYMINEHLAITLDGTNVTHTRQETYGRYANQWISLTDPGYRYTLGVRAAF